MAIAAVGSVGCVDTNDATIELAPDLVSSIDGTLSVRATALADRAPAPDEKFTISVEYTDRNGTPHAIDPVDGTTGTDGSFSTDLTGLSWDGTGTVTATLAGATIAAAATFAVLDRTPPKVTIVPPTNLHVRQNTDLTIQVHVIDEIGVSQVFFETAGQTGNNNNNNRQRSTVVASGTTDAMIGFDMTISQNATVGSTITVYALAADLSGNQAAATPITLTVDPL
ncbi:MAG: hypothetical protein NT062_38280 [Proteobacteria bacterium]|nr:hypothetical protein [Pseudomonadota bacterium]